MTLDVDVTHRLGAFELRARFTAEGGLTALFGRSGSGKTSVVNLIAGLIRPNRGRVVVAGQVLVDTERGIFVPKHRRRLGYVFQEGRLFPHLTVRQNLLFGRWFAPPGGRDGARLEDVVDLLDIGHLLHRGPGALSGGEKQRVAIGRALLAHPRLLLMDEPLASLDEGRRVEILPYIERLRDDAGVPIVYVSHSVAEVARLATTLVVLADGRVSAAGPVLDILGRLDIAALGRESEAGAVLDARVDRHDDAFGLTVLSSAAGPFQVPRLAAPVGARVRAHVRARDVMLSLDPPGKVSALNIVPARVAAVGTGGERSDCEVRLDCNGAVLLARITRKSAQALDLHPGRPVYAVIKSVSFDSPAMAGRPPASDPTACPTAPRAAGRGRSRSGSSDSAPHS